MNSRSARGPLVIGLGTAAILAASTAALAASGTPTPTADPSAAPTPTKLALHVSTSPHSTTAHPGDSVKVTVTITATQSDKLHPTVELTLEADSQAITSDDTSNCDLGGGTSCDVSKFNGKAIKLTFKVTVSTSFKRSDVRFRATATDKSNAFSHGSDYSDITVTPKPTPSPTTPTPTPSATKTSSTPKPTATATGSSGSGGSGSGGGGNLNGSVNPQGSSSPVPSPSVALPAIPAAAPVAQPSVAPDGSTAQPAGNTTALRSGSPAEDLTFERLASTQAAWLAALLVAFSVLLTQVRLGRRPNSAIPAAQFKGAHRRNRKGIFEA